MDEIRAGHAQIVELCAARGRATPPVVTMRIDTCVLQENRAAPAPIHGGSMLAGEPDALVDMIGELAAAGVDHLVLEFLAADSADLDRQLALFAQRVRPQLQ